MSYYQGDFYQGDPGFFSFLGKVAKSAVGFIPGVGPIASKALGMIPSGGTSIVRRTASSAVRSIGGAIIKHPAISAAGAAGVIGAGGIGAAALMRRPSGVPGMMGAGTRGFHISKRTGQPVKNRRMRVTNPKALRRAIRRATGFAHLAKRVLRFTSPRPPRGRAVFKHRRRKRTV